MWMMKVHEFCPIETEYFFFKDPFKIIQFIKFNSFGCFITQLVKKLHQWSLYEVINKYKTASERYLVTELWAKRFWVFFGKNEILKFFENTQNCFANISATNYHSEAILYSKRTAGYPLSPHKKTINVAFLRAE